MKKIVLIIFLFLYNCETNSVSRFSNYPTLADGNSDIGVQVFLRPSGISSTCDINLTLFNRTTYNFNSLFVEITVFSGSNINIGTVRFLEKLSSKQTLQRKSLFTGSDCLKIKDLKLTSLKY